MASWPACRLHHQVRVGNGKNWSQWSHTSKAFLFQVRQGWGGCCNPCGVWCLGGHSGKSEGFSDFCWSFFPFFEWFEYVEHGDRLWYIYIYTYTHMYIYRYIYIYISRDYIMMVHAIFWKTLSFKAKKNKKKKNNEVSALFESFSGWSSHQVASFDHGVTEPGGYGSQPRYDAFLWY